MDAPLSEIEAKLVGLQAGSLSQQAAISAAISYVRLVQQERSVETGEMTSRLAKADNDLLITKETAAQTIESLEGEIRKCQQSALAASTEAHRCEADLVKKAEVVKQELERAKTQVERLQSSLAKEQEGRMADLSAGKNATVKRINELAKLAALVDPNIHDYHVNGKEQAHGQEAKIVYGCSGCKTQVLADKDFI